MTKQKRLDRITIGKASELKDFTEIVQKSDSDAGLMILLDEEGLHAFTYCRPSRKKNARASLDTIERLLRKYFESISKKPLTAP